MMEEKLKNYKKFAIGQIINTLSDEEIKNKNFVRSGINVVDYVNGGMSSNEDKNGIKNCTVVRYEKYNDENACWALIVSFHRYGYMSEYIMIEKEFKEYYIYDTIKIQGNFHISVTASTNLSSIQIQQSLHRFERINHIKPFKISYKNKSGEDKTETIEANTYEEALTKIEYTDIHYYMEL